TGGMAAALDCQEDGTASGTPGSCEPSSEEGDPSYECERCVQELCCTEFAECNASGPTTSCRFGSTLLEGDAVEGEFDCMLSCLRTLDGAVGDQYDVDVCAGRCGAAECDADSAGAAAINL